MLVDPNDSVELQQKKLLKITSVLMRRVEQATNESGAAYAHFHRALMLEEEVRARTADLEQTLELLNQSNAELSRATAAAERARADLSNALEAVQEGFAIFNADDVMVMCNSRFGMHMPDVRQALQPGLTFQEFVRVVSHSPFLALPDGETPESWARKRKRKHRESHVNFNVRVAQDRWIQVSEHRTPDQGTAILQTDVTDMIRLERRERDKLLDDQARLIRATLDHINQGICIFDSEHRLAGSNTRFGELLHLPMSLLRVGRSFEHLFEHIGGDLAFPDGQSLSTLTDWVNHGGGRLPLSLEAKHQGRTYLDVSGQEMPDGGFVISFTDVTAEREAIEALSAINETLEQRVLERTLALEDALQEAERANASKSRFVAAASHDLLQPLSAAKLFISSLEEMALGEGARLTAQKASSALGSVEAILGALLDISKLDSGRAAVEVTAFPIDQILGPLRDEFEPLAQQKGLTLTVMDCKLMVESDPAYLRRILQNLIANAIRYTKSGRVLVGTRRQASSLTLQVWDSGPGIPEDQQDVIFKEFQRLDTTECAGESAGVGLGLAIVERACTLLGHALSLRSQPGRGTAFFVTVPRAAGAAPARTIQRRIDPADGQDAADLIALVIENDRGMRDAMTTRLENWGISVFDVAGQAEAVALLQDVGVAPDVLLVDYQLDGGEDGISAIKEIRRLFGDIPAALVTANRSSELRHACQSTEIHYLNKPVESDALRQFLVTVRPRAALTDGQPALLSAP
ncbi:hybrid sensor histidine kinase/response regulator [Pelagibius marinus]|uniref:hybrid sensor histidine kinase/response regulator n=1 Tax=Pelagibius marinus TaxID=2762760 RepID=UPI001D04B052|nr:PAS-domain containing protein [Pelagibius marinus]